MSKSYKKPIWFYQDLYGVNYYFMPGYKKEDFEASVWNNYGKQFKFREGYGGLTAEFYKEGAYGIYIWIESNKISKKLLSILHHECIHAANMTLDRAGVVADFVNDEPLTYLSQWIFEKCIGHIQGIK